MHRADADAGLLEAQRNVSDRKEYLMSHSMPTFPPTTVHRFRGMTAAEWEALDVRTLLDYLCWRDAKGFDRNAIKLSRRSFAQQGLTELVPRLGHQVVLLRPALADARLDP